MCYWPHRGLDRKKNPALAAILLWGGRAGYPITFDFPDTPQRPQQSSVVICAISCIDLSKKRLFSPSGSRSLARVDAHADPNLNQAIGHCCRFRLPTDGSGALSRCSERCGVRCSDWAQTFGRVDYDSGRPGSDCSMFVIVPDGAVNHRYDDDKRVLRTRRANCGLVGNEFIEEDNVARSRSRYLDHVVEGQSQRIWI